MPVWSKHEVEYNKYYEKWEGEFGKFKASGESNFTNESCTMEYCE